MELSSENQGMSMQTFEKSSCLGQAASPEDVTELRLSNLSYKHSNRLVTRLSPSLECERNKIGNYIRPAHHGLCHQGMTLYLMHSKFVFHKYLLKL